MATRITKLLAAGACALMMAALTAPPGGFPLDSAEAREGGGGGGNGGGGRGGAGGGRGDGGMGVGGGVGRSGQAEAGDRGKGLASRGDNRGTTTSAVARSDETSGLTKAMSVVSSTAAAVAASLNLQSAFDRQAARDEADEPPAE